MYSLFLENNWGFVVSVHSFRIGAKGLCTGSMLSEDIVLTAAHCFRNLDNSTKILKPFLGPNRIWVSSNSTHPDILDNDRERINHEVVQVIPHPNFVSNLVVIK